LRAPSPFAVSKAAPGGIVNSYGDNYFEPGATIGGLNIVAPQ
jgi:hypothetical protein